MEQQILSSIAVDEHNIQGDFQHNVKYLHFINDSVI